METYTIDIPAEIAEHFAERYSSGAVAAWLEDRGYVLGGGSVSVRQDENYVPTQLVIECDRDPSEEIVASYRVDPAEPVEPVAEEWVSTLQNALTTTDPAVRQAGLEALLQLGQMLISREVSSAE